MQLYPKAKVFNSFNLKVSELHTIFVEESGEKMENQSFFFMEDLRWN